MGWLWSLAVVVAQGQGSAEVVAPELIEQPPLTHPYDDARARELGEIAVLVTLAIDADGAVVSAEAHPGADDVLRDAAVAYALALRFKPATVDGVGVPVSIELEVTFTPPAPAPVVAEPVASPLYETHVYAGPEVAEDSPSAVNVVSLARLRTRAADMSLVLRETPGITVRQSGGLGSQARFTLNGLTGLQVPFFVDGIPLALTGLPSDPAAVPVGLVRRLEIMKGVVPIEYGGDALGGAIDLITYVPETTRAFASLELASFGTQRAVMDVSAALADGVVVAAQGFYDHSDNDYEIDVQVTDELGRLSPARVRRFHDGYESFGGNVALRVRDQSWATALDVIAFGSKQLRDLQHGLSLGLVPFGEVTAADENFGATTRYRLKNIADAVDVDAAVNVSRRITRLRDLGTNIYDWNGDIVGHLTSPGELRVSRGGFDQVMTTDTLWTRFNAEWRVADAHRLALNVTPSIRHRDTRNRVLGSDPVSPAKSAELTSGLAYRSSWFDGTLENDAFGKLYFFQSSIDETRIGFTQGRIQQEYFRGGVGDALVYRFTDELRLRASYELATRLPDTDEIFGDGALVSGNPSLKEEASHNVNLAVAASGVDLGFGRLAAQAWGFYRRVENLIFLEVTPSLSRFANVETVQIRGVELGAELIAFNDLLRVGANATWEESKNTSLDGGFARFAGDRIPNRPYAYGSAHAGVRFRDVASWVSRVDLYGSTRYTHGYFISWESAGDPTTKARVPSQVAVDLGSSVTIGGRPLWTTAFEVRNVGDAFLADYYGVPRPGRSFHFKVSAELE